MVGVGDIQRRAQEGNGGEQLEGVHRVLLHHLPLLRRQRPRLVQNLVRDAHLADIVQQRAAADMHQVIPAHPHGPRHLHRLLHHPARVVLGLQVPQLQRVRPALQGGVNGEGQLPVRVLQVVEQAGVVNGDGRLVDHRVQEGKPLLVRQEGAAAVELQHALDLPLGDQRHPEIGLEALRLQVRQAGAQVAVAARPVFQFLQVLRQVGDGDHAPRQGHLPGVAFPQAQPAGRESVGAEPRPGGVDQLLRHRVEEQHVRRVHPQVAGHLLHHQREGHPQVEAAADGLVDAVLGVQAVHPALDLVEQARVLDGDGPDLPHNRQQPGLPLGEAVRRPAAELDHAQDLALRQQGHVQPGALLPPAVPASARLLRGDQRPALADHPALGVPAVGLQREDGQLRDAHRLPVLHPVFGDDQGPLRVVAGDEHRAGRGEQVQNGGGQALVHLPQVQRFGQRAPDGADRGHAGRVLLGLLVQRLPVKGVGGHLAHRVEQAHVRLRHGGAAPDGQRADGLVLGDEGHGRQGRVAGRLPLRPGARRAQFVAQVGRAGGDHPGRDAQLGGLPGRWRRRRGRGGGLRLEGALPVVPGRLRLRQAFGCGGALQALDGQPPAGHLRRRADPQLEHRLPAAAVQHRQGRPLRVQQLAHLLQDHRRHLRPGLGRAQRRGHAHDGLQLALALQALGDVVHDGVQELLPVHADGAAVDLHRVDLPARQAVRAQEMPPQAVLGPGEGAFGLALVNDRDLGQAPVHQLRPLVAVEAAGRGVGVHNLGGLGVQQQHHRVVVLEQAAVALLALLQRLVGLAQAGVGPGVPQGRGGVGGEGLRQGQVLAAVAGAHAGDAHRPQHFFPVHKGRHDNALLQLHRGARDLEGARVLQRLVEQQAAPLLHRLARQAGVHVHHHRLHLFLVVRVNHHHRPQPAPALVQHEDRAAVRFEDLQRPPGDALQHLLHLQAGGELPRRLQQPLQGVGLALQRQVGLRQGRMRRVHGLLRLLAGGDIHHRDQHFGVAVFVARGRRPLQRHPDRLPVHGQVARLELALPLPGGHRQDLLQVSRIANIVQDPAQAAGQLLAVRRPVQLQGGGVHVQDLDRIAAAPDLLRPLLQVFPELLHARGGEALPLPDLVHDALHPGEVLLPERYGRVLEQAPEAALAGLQGGVGPAPFGDVHNGQEQLLVALLAARGYRPAQRDLDALARQGAVAGLVLELPGPGPHRQDGLLHPLVRVVNGDAGEVRQQALRVRRLEQLHRGAVHRHQPDLLHGPVQLLRVFVEIGAQVLHARGAQVVQVALDPREILVPERDGRILEQGAVALLPFGQGRVGLQQGCLGLLPLHDLALQGLVGLPQPGMGAGVLQRHGGVSGEGHRQGQVVGGEDGAGAVQAHGPQHLPVHHIGGHDHVLLLVHRRARDLHPHPGVHGVVVDQAALLQHRLPGQRALHLQRGGQDLVAEIRVHHHHGVQPEPVLAQQVNGAAVGCDQVAHPGPDALQHLAHVQALGQVPRRVQQPPLLVGFPLQGRLAQLLLGDVQQGDQHPPVAVFVARGGGPAQRDVNRLPADLVDEGLALEIRIPLVQGRHAVGDHRGQLGGEDARQVFVQLLQAADPEHQFRRPVDAQHIHPPENGEDFFRVLGAEGAQVFDPGLLQLLPIIFHPREIRLPQRDRRALEQAPEAGFALAQGLQHLQPLVHLALQVQVRAGVLQGRAGVGGEGLRQGQVFLGEIHPDARQADHPQHLLPVQERGRDQVLFALDRRARHLEHGRVVERVVEDQPAPLEHGLPVQAGLDLQLGGEHLLLEFRVNRHHRRQPLAVLRQHVEGAAVGVQDLHRLAPDVFQHPGHFQAGGELAGRAQQVLQLGVLPLKLLARVLEIDQRHARGAGQLHHGRKGPPPGGRLHPVLEQGVEDHQNAHDAERDPGHGPAQPGLRLHAAGAQAGRQRQAGQQRPAAQPDQAARVARVAVIGPEAEEPRRAHQQRPAQQPRGELPLRARLQYAADGGVHQGEGRPQRCQPQPLQQGAAQRQVAQRLQPQGQRKHSPTGRPGQ